MTPHGTRNRYSEHGCRCKPCCAANTAYCREYRERKNAANREWMWDHREHPEFVPVSEVKALIKRGIADRGRTNLIEDYASMHKTSFTLAWNRYNSICYKHQKRTRLEEAVRWSILIRLCPWEDAA